MRIPYGFILSALVVCAIPQFVSAEKPIPPKSFWDEQIHLPNLSNTPEERPR